MEIKILYLNYISRLRCNELDVVLRNHTREICRMVYFLSKYEELHLNFVSIFAEV
jgi:hypothetical protein